jgi:halogenation protein CepH
MSDSGESVDVLVVGGGPAGSCAAGLLARSGISVALMEGKKFPREHIGESLLAMSMPYLRDLGVADIIEEDDFVRKPGAVFRWGGRKEEMRLSMPHPGYAFQVSRDKFDDLLLNQAEKAGVRVLRETWAKRLHLDANGRVDGVVTQEGKSVRHLAARYVIDASGLFQFVPKALGLPVADDGHTRAAVGAYFSGADRAAGPSRDDIITEAAENSWLWFIPLSDDLTSVGMVTDADLIEHRNPQASLDGAIGETDLVRRLLSDATVARRGRLLRYTNHVVDAPLWDRGYVLVGDSAMFVDPLFSTGVHGALMSASHAAGALVSVLAGEIADDVAARWYDDEMRRHYHRVDETVQVLYGVHPGRGEFWKRRDLTGVDRDEADAICRHLGAVGAKFFLNAQGNEELWLPQALADQMTDFRVDISVEQTPESAVPRLADEVTRRDSLVFRKGLVSPGLVLEHQRNRTVRPAYEHGSFMADLIRAVDGRATVGEIVEKLGSGSSDRALCASAIGTLHKAGLLTVA